MKKFFENYGLVVLTAIVVIVLMIIASPIGNAVENGTTSIVGSFQNQVVSATEEINNQLKPNMIITLNGEEYVIIENKLNNQYLVMKYIPIGARAFNDAENNGQINSTCYSNSETDYNYSGCSNIYENSSIDKYLNEEYFSTLPFKNAIVETEIQQTFYKIKYVNTDLRWNNELKRWEVLQNGSWIKFQDHKPTKGVSGAYGYTKVGFLNDTGTESRKIQRKVFLPSVAELERIVNLNDQYEVDKFIQCGPYYKSSTQLRDADYRKHNSLTIHYGSFSIHAGLLNSTWMNVRPCFVIDLSKVDYTNTNELFIK